MTHEEKICYKTWRMKVKICMICSPLSSGRHAVHCEFHHSGLYCTQSPRLRAQKSQTTFLVDKTCYSSLAQMIWRTSSFDRQKGQWGVKEKNALLIWEIMNLKISLYMVGPKFVEKLIYVISMSWECSNMSHDHMFKWDVSATNFLIQLVT